MDKLDDAKLKGLTDELAMALKMFHQEYEKTPLGRNTEFRRGIVTGWRRALYSIYGEKAAEEVADAASSGAGYTIPHGGELSNDGRGYLGFDGSSHTYIGKL